MNIIATVIHGTNRLDLANFACNNYIKYAILTETTGEGMKEYSFDDEQACAKLLVRSSYLADRHDIEGFLGLFSADAVLELRGETFRGIHAIREFMQRRDPNRVTRHIVSPPVIEISDAQRASGVAFFALYDGVNPAAEAMPPVRVPATIGEFRQSYQRHGDRWLIRSYTAVAIFRRAEG